MNNITKAFQKAKAQGNGALIGYIMAGDPNPEQTPKIADALIRGRRRHPRVGAAVF